MASSSPFGLSFQSGVATAYHLFPNRPVFNRLIIFFQANGYALQKQSGNTWQLPPNSLLPMPLRGDKYS